MIVREMPSVMTGTKTRGECARMALQAPVWRFLVFAATLYMLAASVPAGAQTISAGPKRGFLYEATRDAAPGAPAARLILYGTLHVGREDLAPDKTTLALLAASNRLVIEADPLNLTTLGPTLLAIGNYPPGDSLNRHVDETLLQRIAEMVGMDLDPNSLLMRMKPWMLAESLTMLETERVGFKPDQGSEFTLSALARERGVQIVELEGLEAQFKMFDALDTRVQVNALQKAVDDIDTGRTTRELNELVDAWKTADTKIIEEQLDEMQFETGPFAQFMYRDLIVRRDRSMADRAEAFYSQGGTTFFAVGALHLFGRAGLIAELGRRGFHVTAVAR